MIIKDKIKLQEKCSPVSVKEGEEIGVRLLHELRQSENGIGLAANQIGINKRVCVVNVKEPLVLILKHLSLYTLNTLLILYVPQLFYIHNKIYIVTIFVHLQ